MVDEWNDVVLPEMDWVFIQNPTNMTVKKGENVTVPCRPPYSRPVAEVSWFKNNRPLPSTAATTVLPSGDLFFLRCVSGVYRHAVSCRHVHV